MIAEQSTPDFYLIAGDTFWHSLGVDRVACFILDGPHEMIPGAPLKQWLVRVLPKVTDHDIETDLVLVDSHRPDLEGPGFWAVMNTGTYSLRPNSVQGEDGSFNSDHLLAGHKMIAVTDPDSMSKHVSR
jgi:hypothetical protein